MNGSMRVPMPRNKLAMSGNNFQRVDERDLDRLDGIDSPAPPAVRSANVGEAVKFAVADVTMPPVTLQASADQVLLNADFDGDQAEKEILAPPPALISWPPEAKYLKENGDVNGSLEHDDEEEDEGYSPTGMRARHSPATHRDDAMCKVDCWACGERDCPEKSGEHYLFNDGCPSCWVAEEKKKKKFEKSQKELAEYKKKIFLPATVEQPRMHYVGRDSAASDLAAVQFLAENETDAVVASPKGVIRDTIQAKRFDSVAREVKLN